MNIFILSWNPKWAARYHINLHCIKMILETAQLLSTAWWITDESQAAAWYEDKKIYRKTHVNHPCAIWVRQTTSNYDWTLRLGLALCHEYTYRYGKIHKTQAVLHFLDQHRPSLVNGPRTRPPLCMPNQCKRATVVDSYRQYYLQVKRETMKCEWKHRNPPSWWQ